MKTLEHSTVGEVVADDYRAATIFSKYGIDFCCKGNQTIEEACQKKNINPAKIQEEIAAIINTTSTTEPDFKSWSTDMLIDYIEKKHHKYVEENSGLLLVYLNKLCKVHAQRHPELLEIEMHFKNSVGDLAQHMKKEELVLFPFIRKMLMALDENISLEKPRFGTVENPIAMMMHEHDNEGERFRFIAELSNNYTPPADACQTYKVTFALLKEFEEDLHKHIHLENNILFPRAQKLETKLYSV